MMIRSLTAAALGGAMLLGTAGCAQVDTADPTTRALGGAAIGAGTGAAVSGLAGGRAGTGALVGGALGAAGGALTTPGQAWGGPAPAPQPVPPPRW